MIALIGDFHFTELLVIAAFAVMIFGRNLPKVAAQAFTNLQRARRSLGRVWRDTGIAEEMRRLQRELDETRRELERKVERDVDRLDRESARAERAYARGGSVRLEPAEPLVRKAEGKPGEKPDAARGVDGQAQGPSAEEERRVGRGTEGPGSP